MTYRDLWLPLTAVADEREARAMAAWLLDVVFGLSLTDVAAGALEQLPDDDGRRLASMQQRLLQGEPVQYVAGVAHFGPRLFAVTPDVLIPRPETYELCRWLTQTLPVRPRSMVLDMGTGSGCIACTLALDRPDISVTACDISQEALQVARHNAQRLGANVGFVCGDALHMTVADRPLWTAIVSNPPYICQRERHTMQRQVVDYEPHLALFVPDDDPLLFYRAMARYGLGALLGQGALFFEVDADHADQVAELLRHMGYTGIEQRSDQFFRPRFIKATRP